MYQNLFKILYAKIHSWRFSYLSVCSMKCYLILYSSPHQAHWDEVIVFLLFNCKCKQMYILSLIITNKLILSLLFSHILTTVMSSRKRRDGTMPTSSLGLHCVSLAGVSGMETRNGGGKRRLQFRCRTLGAFRLKDIPSR